METLKTGKNLNKRSADTFAHDAFKDRFPGDTFSAAFRPIEREDTDTDRHITRELVVIDNWLRRVTVLDAMVSHKRNDHPSSLDEQTFVADSILHAAQEMHAEYSAHVSRLDSDIINLKRRADESVTPASENAIERQIDQLRTTRHANIESAQALSRFLYKALDESEDFNQSVADAMHGMSKEADRVVEELNSSPFDTGEVPRIESEPVQSDIDIVGEAATRSARILSNSP